MLNMTLILAWLYNGMLVAISGYAVVRGGRPERIGAAVCLVASWGTAIIRFVVPAEWMPAAALVLFVDIAVIAIFFWLAITTIRFWPIWATGFALANVLGSAIGTILPQIQLFAFQTGSVAYAYLVLVVIALGVHGLGRHADPVVRNGSRKLWLLREQHSTR